MLKVVHLHLQLYWNIDNVTLVELHFTSIYAFTGTHNADAMWNKNKQPIEKTQYKVQTKMEQQRSEHNKHSEHYKHNNVSMEILGSLQSNFVWLAKRLSFILVS